MEGVPTLIAVDPQRQAISGGPSVSLLRRVVESLPLARPGRYVVYLGRPEPAAVRADQEREFAMIRNARRAVVITSGGTLLPSEAERRDPGQSSLKDLWFSAVLGDQATLALVAQVSSERDQAWLMTDPDAVRRFIAGVEAELASPDPQLLAV